MMNVVEPKGAEPLPWYVVLTNPQQDLTTVWRLHELGLELFVPVLRRRVKTGRTGKNGVKLTRIIAKPMFPGYGFLRATIDNLEPLKNVRGFRDLLRDEQSAPVMLPHQAVMAVFAKQREKHDEWLEQGRRQRFTPFKRGDSVRIDDDGGAYAGLIGRVDKVDSRGRIEILLGMIRHKFPMQMVVAA